MELPTHWSIDNSVPASRKLRTKKKKQNKAQRAIAKENSNGEDGGEWWPLMIRVGESFQEVSDERRWKNLIVKMIKDVLYNNFSNGE